MRNYDAYMMPTFLLHKLFSWKKKSLPEEYTSKGLEQLSFTAEKDLGALFHPLRWTELRLLNTLRKKQIVLKRSRYIYFFDETFCRVV